jgi:alanine dehydrogenase
MRVGIPRETKDRELRVGMLPDGVRELVAAGHEVLVEQGAGCGTGFADTAYAEAGAKLVSAEETWSSPQLVVKVKEPNLREVAWLRPGQTLFTFLHLAAAGELTQALLDADVQAIAYETIRDAAGHFPVLAPMSQVAGRLAAQIGAHYLQGDHGGKGLLLGGVPGVARGRVTVLGAGTVGSNAMSYAHALGAEVDVLDVDLTRLASISERLHGRITTLHASQVNIERSVRDCDLLIGAVYSYGRRAPTLVSEAAIAAMEPGSVVVDVAVDQGGCIETIHPTSHSEPTYRVHEVIHYGVPNIPGAVPRTSTLALSNVTLPLVLELAALGVERALLRNPALALGANVWRGEVVCPGVAESLGLRATPLETLLAPEA